MSSAVRASPPARAAISVDEVVRHLGAERRRAAAHDLAELLVGERLQLDRPGSARAAPS